MQLTHANVVLAALPPHSRKEGADRQRRDFVYKVQARAEGMLACWNDRVGACFVLTHTICSRLQAVCAMLWAFYMCCRYQHVSCLY